MGSTSLYKSLSSPQIPSLDGIRAIAVILVVVFHYGLPINGPTGVMAFFVLSGFLISWLLLKEEKRWGRVSLKLFFYRRILRIFPNFYVYICVIIGVWILIKRPIPWGQVGASLIYTTNYYSIVMGDPNNGLSHAWSLSIEEQFYLLWPAIFVFLKDNRLRIRCLLGAILATWIYRWGLVAWNVPGTYIYLSLETRADHLLVGCALAIALYERRITGLVNIVTKSPHLIWLTAGVLALSSTAALSVPRYRDAVGFTIDPLLIALLLVQSIAFASTSAAWLNHPVVAWIGRLSYSIYLYQQVLIHPLQKQLGKLPLWIELPIAFACIVLFAAVVHRLIELPFLRWKDTFKREVQETTTPPTVPLTALASK